MMRLNLSTVYQQTLTGETQKNILQTTDMHKQVSHATSQISCLNHEKTGLLSSEQHDEPTFFRALESIEPLIFICLRDLGEHVALPRRTE